MVDDWSMGSFYHLELFEPGGEAAPTGDKILLDGGNKRKDKPIKNQSGGKTEANDDSHDRKHINHLFWGGDHGIVFGGRGLFSYFLSSGDRGKHHLGADQLGHGR